MSLFGIFLGQSIGIGALVPMFLFEILRWDWNELAEEANSKTASGALVADFSQRMKEREMEVIGLL